MVDSVITYGAILTVVLIVLGIFMAKSSMKGSSVYVPFAFIFIMGIVCMISAPIVGKVDLMGIGFGGWGIVCLFSATIGAIITSIVDVYAHHQNA